MKHLLLTTIAAVLVVGCGEAQQSAPAPETKPAEPVAEATKPTTPPKAPDISIRDAAREGNIEAVKQHLTAGTDVDAKDDGLSFPRGPVFFSTTSTTIIATLSSCGSGFA